MNGRAVHRQIGTLLFGEQRNMELSTGFHNVLIIVIKISCKHDTSRYNTQQLRISVYYCCSITAAVSDTLIKYNFISVKHNVLYYYNMRNMITIQIYNRTHLPPTNSTQCDFIPTNCSGLIFT